MPDDLSALLVRLWRLAVLDVLAVRLDRGHEVELRRTLARTRTDGTTVHHDTRTVQPADCILMSDTQGEEGDSRTSY